MPRSRLELIAFDGDDTLWHNERSYRRGRERFRGLFLRFAGNEPEVLAYIRHARRSNDEHPHGPG